MSMFAAPLADVRMISACARGLPVDSFVETRTRSRFDAFAGSRAHLTQALPSPEYMQSKHQTSVSSLIWAAPEPITAPRNASPPPENPARISEVGGGVF